MVDLRVRFGKLLAAQRKRQGLTQEALAEKAGISADMVAKVEIGQSGARFGVIQKLSRALKIDPAELFSYDIPTGALTRGTLGQITAQLAQLPEQELVWVRGLLNAALSRVEPTQRPKVRSTRVRSRKPDKSRSKRKSR